MKKKAYLGLAQDRNKIYAAHLTRVKGVLQLVDIEVLELPESIEHRPKPKPGGPPPEPEDDTVFGLDDDDLSDFESISMDDDDIPDESDSGKTKVGYDESEDEETNEQILSNYLNTLGDRKLITGINIPQGRTIFQPLQGVNLKKMKKKEQDEFINEKLAPIYNEQIDADKYTWEVDDDGDGWLVSHDNGTDLINLIDLAEITYDGKVRIHEMLSDEVIWTGLVQSHYRLGEEEITGLLSIGERTTRLVFLKGHRIFHVLPVINEGGRSRNVKQTVFSKLLFEIDKGTLPALDRLLIMHSTTAAEQVRDFFRDQFIDVEVDLFRPDPEKLQLPEEIQKNPEVIRPYLTAIGAAQAAARIDTAEWPSLSLLPEFVIERYKIFKLQWHGAALLVCIALAPLLVNHWYQDYVSERQQLERELSQIETEITELRPVAADVERMTEEQAVLREKNARVIELSENTLLWSRILGQINEGMAEIPNTWLTTFRVDGDELSVEGHTLYRQRVPLVTRVFDDARIERVEESEVRDATIHNFSLKVHDYLADPDRFTPEIPEPDEDYIREVELR